jgi:hypothetical protein
MDRKTEFSKTMKTWKNDDIQQRGQKILIFKNYNMLVWNINGLYIDIYISIYKYLFGILNKLLDKWMIM